MNEVGKKYSERNLRNMRRYYLLFKNEKWNAMRSKLSWTHYRELLSLSDNNEIEYYVKITIDQNLSYRELHNKNKSNEYERLDNKTKLKLIKEEKNMVNDFIKHPVRIRNIYDTSFITEKMLKNAILEDIDNFLLELGSGFTYVGNEYKIKLGNRYNYIDMLLFNYIYNCFVVVELKVTEIKKEHIGQIMLYMNYVDEHIKKINHNKTIGIIIAKYGNEYVIRYCYNENIYETTYELV